MKSITKYFFIEKKIQETFKRREKRAKFWKRKREKETIRLFW